MNRILLFGGLVPPDKVVDIPDVNEAGNRFQMDMSLGLIEAGVGRITAISAITVAAVPLPRRVVVRSEAWDLANGIDIVAPGFVNLLPFKPMLVHTRLKAAALRIGGDVDAILAFSPTPIGHATAGLSVAARLGVPFVCITTDYSPDLRPRSPLRAFEQSLATRVVRNSDGLIVVSGHTPRDLGTDAPWLKIDGGVADDWGSLPDVSPRDKTVVFAGTPDLVRGAGLLLDAFAHISDPDMRLIFAGRGGLADEIEAAARADGRIEMSGFLTRAELQRLLASATVLVNPRLSSAPENRHNFPAKLLDYLASGRPTITTLAGDLDPVYSEIAIPLRDESPQGLADVIVEVCARDQRELARIGASGRTFALGERSWRQQAARVASFIEDLVERGPRRPV